MPQVSRIVVLACALLAGCASVRYPHAEAMVAGDVVPAEAVQAHEDRRRLLREDLLALGHGVSELEAEQVADTALLLPMSLADDYELTKPAIAHNVLVNWGLRPRGLCIHWTEDLLLRLQAMDLQTFDLHWGVAYPRRPWRLEHSSVVVTAKGEPFETGILLDGWRDSGWLFWAQVPTDERYHWERLSTIYTDAAPPGRSELVVR